jgi:hypothetical protein
MLLEIENGTVKLDGVKYVPEKAFVKAGRWKKRSGVVVSVAKEAHPTDGYNWLCDDGMTCNDSGRHCHYHDCMNDLVEYLGPLEEPKPAPTPGDGYRWATEKDVGKVVEFSDDGIEWRQWDAAKLMEIKNGFFHAPSRSFWKYARRKIERREVTPTMEHVGKTITLPDINGQKRKLLNTFIDPRGENVFVILHGKDSWTWVQRATITLDENDEVVE